MTRRCKLEIVENIIEQVMKFKYLGAEITNNGDLKNETMKEARIPCCLRDMSGRINL